LIRLNKGLQTLEDITESEKASLTKKDLPSNIRRLISDTSSEPIATNSELDILENVVEKALKNGKQNPSRTYLQELILTAFKNQPKTADRDLKKYAEIQKELLKLRAKIEHYEGKKFSDIESKWNGTVEVTDNFREYVRSHKNNHDQAEIIACYEQSFLYATGDLKLTRTEAARFSGDLCFNSERFKRLLTHQYVFKIASDPKKLDMNPIEAKRAADNQAWGKENDLVINIRVENFPNLVAEYTQALKKPAANTYPEPSKIDPWISPVREYFNENPIKAYTGLTVGLAATVYYGKKLHNKFKKATPQTLLSPLPTSTEVVSKNKHVQHAHNICLNIHQILSNPDEKRSLNQIAQSAIENQYKQDFQELMEQPFLSNPRQNIRSWSPEEEKFFIPRKNEPNSTVPWQKLTLPNGKTISFKTDLNGTSFIYDEKQLKPLFAINEESALIYLPTQNNSHIWNGWIPKGKLLDSGKIEEATPANDSKKPTARTLSIEELIEHPRFKQALPNEKEPLREAPLKKPEDYEDTQKQSVQLQDKKYLLVHADNGIFLYDEKNKPVVHIDMKSHVYLPIDTKWQAFFIIHNEDLAESGKPKNLTNLPVNQQYIQTLGKRFTLNTKTNSDWIYLSSPQKNSNEIKWDPETKKASFGATEILAWDPTTKKTYFKPNPAEDNWVEVKPDTKAEEAPPAPVKKETKPPSGVFETIDIDKIINK
jgi:hypothetical protein